jgi:RHS repeat-associated protein
MKGLKPCIVLLLFLVHTGSVHASCMCGLVWSEKFTYTEADALNYFQNIGYTGKLIPLKGCLDTNFPSSAEHVLYIAGIRSSNALVNSTCMFFSPVCRYPNQILVPYPGSETLPPPQIRVHCKENSTDMYYYKNLGHPSHCPVGNPINQATGLKYQEEVDYRSPTPDGLNFVRYYNSYAPLPIKGASPHWRHTYSREIVKIDKATVIVHRPDGKSLHFSSVNDEWVSQPDVTDRLEERLDGQGKRTSWRYVTSRDSVESYDALGRLQTIRFRSGRTLTLSYDARDHLIAVSSDVGRTLNFAYDTASRLATLTDPAGGVYRYTYDARGNLSAVRYPDDTPQADSDNPVRAYLYEDPNFPHALTGIVDENNARFATWAYDAQGRAVLSEHAGSADRVELSYNADGTTTVTDALGAARTYAFTTRHGVVKPTSISGDQCSRCGGQAQARTYDANGFLASKTDWNGHVTIYTYDDRGLQVSRIEAVGTPAERTVTTEWHPEFRLPTLITEPAKTTAFTYDTAGRLLTRTETDTATQASRTWIYTYTAQGLLASVDGPRTDVSDVTTFEYDAQGNRLLSTDALGHVTAITAHDAHGRPLTLVDPNGVTITLSYDARGRLRSRSNGGATSTFDYDDVGNLIRLTWPNGAYLDYGYDAAHRLISVADNLGHRLEYTLDAQGHRTAENVYDRTSTLRRTQSWVYNQLGRLIEALGAQAQTTRYGYDGNGHPISITDPLNRTTTQAFDALERLIRTTDPLHGETAYTYDRQDHLTSVTDPRGLTTTYGYDGLGHLIQQQSPDTGPTTYTYDTAGNRLTQTDARGVTITYTYDALNRLTRIQYPDSTLDVSYSYDQGLYGVGRLTGQIDAGGDTTYGYDARGNLITVLKSIHGVLFMTRYAYDLADNLIQITYPSGRTVDYGREAAGRITSVTTTFEGLTQTVADNIRYLPFGPVESLTYGNGLIRRNTYDRDYRLTDAVTGSVHALSYLYDARGNITEITDLNDSSRTQRFGYDALDRLVSAGGVYGDLGYRYDAVGNRLSRTLGLATDTYTYATLSHRLLEITGPQARRFAYDAAGNTTRAASTTFTFDARNRLSQANVDGHTATYTYNAEGARVLKTLDGETTVFHYDLGGRLLAETDAAGTTLREYLYLDDRRLAMVARASQPSASKYSFYGPAQGGNRPATLLADLDDRRLILTDSDGHRLTHQFDEENWRLEEKKTRTRIRFRHQNDKLKLSGRLVFPHHDDGTPHHDVAKAFIRVVQSPERTLHVRYQGTGGQTHFTGTDRKTGEPVTLHFDLDTHTIEVTFQDGATHAFTLAEDQWVETHPRPHRTRIDYHFDDGHTTLWGTLRLNKHKTVATVKLQQGQLYRATYKAMTGQPQTQPAAPHGLYYLHPNHLNTPQVITDENQQIVWEVDYRPFGQTTITTNTVDNPLRFPGQYFDNETGLHYNYFRDYDPTTGRYIESDPIGLEGGINDFEYVHSNPVAWTDPYGLIRTGHPKGFTTTDAYRRKAQSAGAQIFGDLSYLMGMGSLGIEIKRWLRGIAGPLTIGGVVFGTMSQFLEITNLKPDGDNDNDGIPDIGDSDDDNDGYPDESDPDPYIWDPPKPPRDDEKDCPPSSWSSPAPSPCTWDFSTSPAKLKCPIGIYY